MNSPQFHPWHSINIGDDAPSSFQVVIEIPRGSKVKYELDKESGMIKVDRILYSSVVYPANYGFIPQTLSLDGDAVDALVLMQEPVIPLSIVNAVPIGMMKMIDHGENDEKIICIHKDDPEYCHFTHFEQLPGHRMDALKRFFKDYKKLENKQVKVEDFVGPEEAKSAIIDGQKLYLKEYGNRS